MERIRIKDLPHKDRPYEKCLSLGPDSLSDTELLAVILRTGSREGNSLDLADSLLALEAQVTACWAFCITPWMTLRESRELVR